MVPADSELVREQTGCVWRRTESRARAPAERPQVPWRIHSMHERARRRQCQVPLVLMVCEPLVSHRPATVTLSRPEAPQAGLKSRPPSTDGSPACGSDRAAPLGAPAPTPRAVLPPRRGSRAARGPTGRPLASRIAWATARVVERGRGLVAARLPHRLPAALNRGSRCRRPGSPYPRPRGSARRSSSHPRRWSGFAP